MYIGKKSFYSKRKVKGKFHRVTKESNWKTYKTSNKFLKLDIKENFNNYHFEIIYLCKDPSITSYLETKTIFEENAMVDPHYYNANVRITLLNKLINHEARFKKV